MGWDTIKTGVYTLINDYLNFQQLYINLIGVTNGKHVARIFFGREVYSKTTKYKSSKRFYD